MEESNHAKRRVFRWSGAARETARAYLYARKHSEESRQGIATDLKLLVAKLVEVSGNPRDASWRFVRQFGIREKQSYRTWTTFHHIHYARPDAVFCRHGPDSSKPALENRDRDRGARGRGLGLEQADQLPMDVRASIEKQILRVAATVR